MKVVFFATTIVLSASLAFGEGSVSYDTSTGQTSAGSNSGSRKIDKRKNNTKSKSTSHTVSRSIDENVSNTLKEMADARANKELDLSMPAQTVFVEYLRELELGTTPLPPGTLPEMAELIKASIVTQPRYQVDFGLATVDGGYTNSRLESWLKEQAGNKAPLSAVVNQSDIDKMRGYLKKSVVLGGAVGQAYHNLHNAVKAADPRIKGLGNPKDLKNVEIAALGAEDFRRMARASLNAVLIGGITDRSILSSIKNSLVMIDKDCRLFNEPSTVACMDVVVTLGNPTTVVVAGIDWTGKSFAGFSGNYRMSTGWSYSQTIDKLASYASSKRIADDVARRLEDSESKGDAREFAIEARTGVERAAKGNQSVTPKFKGGGK